MLIIKAANRAIVRQSLFKICILETKLVRSIKVKVHFFFRYKNARKLVGNRTWKLKEITVIFSRLSKRLKVYPDIIHSIYHVTIGQTLERSY